MDKVFFKERDHTYHTTEELKTLRTNIQFCGDDKRVFMVTSCISGEGKSSLVFDLARSLAELKKKVLILDCDLRKSVLRSSLAEGSRAEFGLSHVLAGRCELKDALYATNIPGLSVVFSGVIPPNPTELLSGDAFGKIIRVFRGIFDYIIVDCAPLGMVIDAAIVASQCDASILVIEAGTIKYRFAQETKRKLENTGCPFVGVVLNKVDYKNSGKYYGKYYGERYTKYYE